MCNISINEIDSHFLKAYLGNLLQKFVGNGRIISYEMLSELTGVSTQSLYKYADATNLMSIDVLIKIIKAVATRPGGKEAAKEIAQRGFNYLCGYEIVCSTNIQNHDPKRLPHMLSKSLHDFISRRSVDNLLSAGKDTLDEAAQAIQLGSFLTEYGLGLQTKKRGDND